MKKKSTWFIINRFFAPKLGKVVTREALMQFRKELNLGSSVENYRLYLTRAGFLKHISRGKYKVVRKIPVELTVTELFNLAYPLTKEDLGRVCFRCAKRLGWRWPKHHCATACYEDCPYCGKNKSCVATSDWLRPGQKRLLIWD